MSGTKPFRILIADDNAVNQRVLHDLLKMRGYSVSAVNDGLEVLKALESESFDLVILDCLMPGMDGYQTCRTIRAADRARLNPEVPILAVTALASEADRRKCFQVGMNDYISKPIRAKALFKRVEGLLRQSGAGDGDGAGTGSRVSHASEKDGLDQARRSVRDALISLSSRLEDDIAQWQTELGAFLEREAYEEIRLLAHKIRGTADLADWSQLSELSAGLERAAGSRHKADVRALTPRVIESLRRLRQLARVEG